MLPLAPHFPSEAPPLSSGLTLRPHAVATKLETLPFFAQLGNDAIDKGVVWVAVNSGAPKTTGADVEANEAGIKSMGLEYPVLLDPSGWVGRMYEATNTPHMFIIDKAGKLIYRGAHEDKEGVFLVEKALLEHGSGNKISSPRTNAFGCQVH